MSAPPGPNPLRELLFADLPPAGARTTFARGGAATAYLVELAEAAERRDAHLALGALTRVPPAERETRLHLQAWSLARAAGVDLRDAGRDALGVVVDVHLDDGLDTLAGYLDGSARYLHHLGGATVWEAPDAAIGGLVRRLLDSASVIVAMGGPLDGPRFGPPPAGHTAIWVLTRSGTYAGTGPSEAISADARGGPVMAAATALLQGLVERTAEANPPGG